MLAGMPRTAHAGEGLMEPPPRNRELEQLVIDVLRTTADDSPDRHAAWQVYADWLLGHGEPVGEWLAASLRADDRGEAAAPIRARLHEIAAATRFRLVQGFHRPGISGRPLLICHTMQ